jgi:hypothetical protein
MAAVKKSIQTKRVELQNLSAVLEGRLRSMMPKKKNARVF